MPGRFILISFFIFTPVLQAGNYTNKPAEDSSVLELSKEILTLVKEKDYYSLAKYIHPLHGIRFSPYAYVDTVNDQRFSRSKFKTAVKRRDYDIYNWGSYDGTGDPILLTAKKYFKRFVYDADFLNAEKTSLNQKLVSGNTISNLEEIYPGCVFTESYFSGFDEKYSGMDWRSLRLVYKLYNGKYYLVGIRHDEWTI